MIYIALLRGVNVGGKNMIKMSELKMMFESLGYQEVQTYIQSGNVLFRSYQDEDFLRQQIEEAIHLSFGLHVIVMLRTLDELKYIVQNIPFAEEEIAQVEAIGRSEVLYVSLFSKIPSQKDVERLAKYDGGDDKYMIKGRDIYFLFSKSIRNSKLSTSIQKMTIPSTSRNMKTMNKLIDLAQRML